MILEERGLLNTMKSVVALANRAFAYHYLWSQVAMCHGVAFDPPKSINPTSYLFQWVSNVVSHDDDR